MSMQLVVVRPFGAHSRGDVVTDPGQIAKILASESAANVVRVGVPAVPPASPGPAVASAGATPKGN